MPSHLTKETTKALKFIAVRHARSPQIIQVRSSCHRATFSTGSERTLGTPSFPGSLFLLSADQGLLREGFKMTSVFRFAPALAPTLLLLLMAGAVRAGDEPVNVTDGFHAPEQDTPGPLDDAFASLNTCTPEPSAAFETSASLLFLQPNSGNLVYSTVINPFPFLSPHWSDQAVNPDFTPAFNIGLRYIFAGGCDIRLDWTHLNAFDSASTQVASPYALGQVSGPSSIQALGPSSLIGPPLPFSTAIALAHFAYDAVNFDAGLLLVADSHVQLRAFAGLQFAPINQSLSTNFLSSDGTLSFTNVPQSLFTGVGPRLGINVHYLFGNLDLRGAIAGSTLIGNRQSRIDFFTSSPMDAGSGLTPNAQYLTAPDSTQVIPCLDAKLGASYAIPVGKIGVLKCEAGYQAAVYINVINQFTLSEVENSLTLPSEGIAAVFLRTAVESQSNFFVHGPFVKVAFQF